MKTSVRRTMVDAVKFVTTQTACMNANVKRDMLSAPTRELAKVRQSFFLKSICYDIFIDTNRL